MPSKVHRVNTTIMCTGPSLCKNYWNFVNICPGNLLEICSVGFVYRGLEYVFCVMMVYCWMTVACINWNKLHRYSQYLILLAVNRKTGKSWYLLQWVAVRCQLAVWLVAWQSGRTSVFDRQTFLVLCLTCSWWVTTYVGKPSAVGQPTMPTRPFILSG